MDRIRQTFRNLKDLMGIFRIITTYTLSNAIKYPEGDDVEINEDSSLKILSSPKNPIGNILILQGGVNHTNSKSYYIKVSMMLMSRNVRVFLFQKTKPMLNLDYAKDISEAIDYIKDNFDGPVCIIGYSMGGILLLSYLGMGYDQGDLYIPVCCPLDLLRFYDTINNHIIFRLLKSREFNHFNTSSDEELLKCAGLTYKEHIKKLKGFIPNLNKNKEQWLPKTVYIVSTDDPLTQNFKEEIGLLDEMPITYLVLGGWHCCLESIFLTVMIACNYLKARSKGITLTPDKIKYF